MRKKKFSYMGVGYRVLEKQKARLKRCDFCIRKTSVKDENFDDEDEKK